MSEKSLSLEETKVILDKVSPTFCGAKWTQVLFQFHLGSLHNCCLTPVQAIDKKNLFNSVNLINQRQQMLNGEKISDCKVCWKAEEQGLVSDRHYKSSEPSNKHLYKPESKIEATNVNPTYIELSLSNRCQFKCAYCSPENSSSLFAEAMTYGPYRLKESFSGADYLYRNDNYFLENDENPYVDAFIEWYPGVASGVKVLRFTGGEPLLGNRLFEILNLLKENPSPELELIFNSNMGVSDSVMDKFIQQLLLLPKGIYGELTFITSIDGWGEGAKFVRWGLELDVFERNLKKLRTTFPDAKIRITSTLNLLALGDMKRLLEKMLEWKKDQLHTDQILLTAYPLHYPAFLSLKWCSSWFKEDIDEILNFMHANFIGDWADSGFKSVEKNMLEKALLNEASTTLHEETLIDFAMFMIQHKHRKGWNVSILAPKVQTLLEEGIKLLNQKVEAETIDPLMTLKAFPWFHYDQFKVQKLLAAAIKNKTVNAWKVLDTQLSYLDYLDPSWVGWWYEIQHSEGGNRLYRHPEFKSKVDINSLVQNYAHGFTSHVWLDLIQHEEPFKSLSIETLLFLPDVSSGEMLAFFEKVKACGFDFSQVDISKLQQTILTRISSEKINGWILEEVFLQATNLDASWVDFWFTHDHAEIAVAMISNGMDKKVNVSDLILKHCPKASAKFWAILIKNVSLFSKLDEGTLQKIFHVSPQPMKPEQTLFWMLICKRHPNLIKLLKPTSP